MFKLFYCCQLFKKQLNFTLTKKFFYRIISVEKKRELLLNTHDRLRHEIEEHFNEFIENELNKKKSLLEERVTVFGF
jgi:hypothetical protein